MIRAFGARATRARAADWVELAALCSPVRRLTRAELLRSQSILEEDSTHEAELLDFDIEHVDDREEVDAEILDRVSEDLAERVYDELSYRARTLGAMYPFELVETFNSWIIQARPAQTREQTSAHLCYVACLLMTAMRTEIMKDYASAELKKTVADAFQGIAYINAAEIVGGKAFSMGFPRPDGTNMMDAVVALVAEMQLGKAVSAAPTGASLDTKDGGVDVVAWRTFKDAYPGGIVLYGQVASGEDWLTKPIQGNLRGFHPFFSKRPTMKALHALFVPRVQHDDLPERKDCEFRESAIDFAYSREEDFGLIIDRLRLTELTYSTASSQRNEPSEFARCAAAALKWTKMALSIARSDS